MSYQVSYKWSLSSQSRDSELHTLEQNELLVTEKEDGHWDSGEKNSPNVNRGKI